MKAYADMSGSQRAMESVEKASEVFLSHHLFKRKADGEVMDKHFIRIAYPPYWHYDILAGLRVMAEVGCLSDPRCDDALDLLESRRLPGGGFNADIKYYKVVDAPREGTGYSFVDWGGTSKNKLNEWVTVTALSLLKRSGRKTY